MGSRRHWHDQYAGGQIGARGGTVLRHDGAGDRLRLLARDGRASHRGRDPRDACAKRGAGQARAALDCAFGGRPAGLPLPACLAELHGHASATGSEFDSQEAGSPDGSRTVTGEKGDLIDMGKLLVVGSVALDTVKTPFGEGTEILGGSATYFSTSASFFTSVALIAVVGEDFPQQHVAFLQSRGIDLTGLERRPGATFRWKGEYTHQLNEARTLDTKLNVFETFRPKIPDAYRTPDVLFLGN